MEVLTNMDVKCFQSEKNYLMSLAGLAETEHSWERMEKSMGGSDRVGDVNENPLKAGTDSPTQSSDGPISAIPTKSSNSTAQKRKLTKSKSQEYSSDETKINLMDLDRSGKLELSSGTWSPIPSPAITPSASKELTQMPENLSYYQRVVISLKALGGDGATYASICEYFARHWTKLTEEKKNWKQAIASELSHKFGRRIDKQEGVTLWTLNKDIQEKKPQLKPRKKRKIAQQSSTRSSGDSWKKQPQYSDSDIESPNIVDEEKDVRSSPRRAKKSKRDHKPAKYADDDESDPESAIESDSETNAPVAGKNELIQSFKQTELSKWKPIIQNTLIVISRECTLNEILNFIEDHHPEDVTSSRLWKGLVSSCLRVHFQSFKDHGETYWYLSQDEAEEVTWPSDIIYQSSLDWSNLGIQEDLSEYIFCFDYMRTRPSENSLRGEVRSINTRHQSFVKGERERGYFLLESAKIGDYIGEYTGDVVRRSSRTKDSRFRASLWAAPTFDLEVDASNSGNEMRFVNCISKKGRTKPNVALIRMYDPITFLPCIGVFATTDIKSGNEVLLDISASNLLNPNMKSFTVEQSQINSKTNKESKSKVSSDDEDTQSD